MRVHDDELDVDDALVRALVDEQFPQWADLPLVRAGDGTVNVVYRLVGDLSVRLPRRVGRETAEDRVLAAVGGLPVEVPRLVAVGRPQGAYPWEWAVHTWLHGDLPDGDLSPDDVASVVVALQRIEATGPDRKHEDYRVIGSVQLPRVTGFRLEVLPGAGGLLARSKTGHFILTDIKVQVRKRASNQVREILVAAAIAGLTGQEQASVTISTLRENFAHPPDDARIMMRWWWFGSAVTKPELEREMKVMKAVKKKSRARYSTARNRAQMASRFSSSCQPAGSGFAGLVVSGVLMASPGKRAAASRERQRPEV